MLNFRFLFSLFVGLICSNLVKSQAPVCDGTKTGDGVYCIKYFADLQTFAGAESNCEAWGGTLVEIFNSEIQQTVEREIQKQPAANTQQISAQSTQTPSAWIGASEDTGVNANLWTWTNACPECITGAGACYGPAFDIVFLLDSSGSIQDNAPPGVNNWQFMLDLVINFVSAVKVGVDDVHVGLVTFSNDATKIFGLGDFHDLSLMINAINDTPYVGGNTNTYAGLQMALTEIFGATGDRPNIQNVVVIVTDGVSTTNHAQTLLEAALLQNISTVFSIGVTDQIDVTELSMLSSAPHQQNVSYWLLDTYAELEVFAVIGSILDDLCAGLYVKSYGGSAPGWSLTSQGCYRDSTTNPQFSFIATANDNKLTMDMCIMMCAVNGFQYAAAQNGVTCYCGNQFGGSQYPLTSQCTVPCAGNSNQLCGGLTQNSVFRINGLWGTWGSGQPDNGNGQQFCGAIDTASGYKLGDIDCTTPSRYLCEIPLRQCGLYGSYIVYQSRCIFVSLPSDKLSWFQAREECVMLGGDLLSISSNDMMTTITVGLSPLVGSDRYFWLGLARQQWLWQSGDAVVYNQFTAGEPASPLDALCAVINWNIFDWSTSQCSNNRPYICMRDLFATPNPRTTTTLMTPVTVTTANNTNDTLPDAGASSSTSGLTSTDIIIIIVVCIVAFLLLLILLIILLVRCCCAAGGARVATLLDARPMAGAPEYTNTAAFQSKQLSEKDGSITGSAGSLIGRW